MSRLFRLAVAALAVTTIALLLGGYRPDDPSGPLPLLHRAAVAAAWLLVLTTAALAHRRDGVSRFSRRSAWTAVGLATALPLLGAAVAVFGEPGWIGAAQVGAAFALPGSALVTVYNLALDRGAPGWLVAAAAAPAAPQPLVARFAAAGVAATLVIILSGAATGEVSPLACAGWPFCVEGSVLPADASAATFLHLAHRAAAVAGAVALLAVAWLTHRRPSPPLARRLSEWALGLVAVQILLGGNLIVSDGLLWFRGGHFAVGTLLWLMGVLTLAATARPSAVPAGARLAGGGRWLQPALGVELARAAASSPRPQPPLASGAAALVADTPSAIAFPTLPSAEQARQTIADYVALTKPGIQSLLLTTTLCAMLIADPRGVAFFVIAATLLGGALAAGGANVLNCYIDRDIDAIMPRTRHRATVSGRVSPRAALTFGLTLSALAVVELGLLVNWLAAGLALAGNLFYVLIYTRWLKRATPQNIVIGGAAGAFPPLVGWAAATGGLAPVAWLLFAVVFAWTPPHFWALALLKQGEYGRAAVPMLPVVAGEAATRRQIVLYSALLFAVCLLLVPAGLGPVFLAAAVALNGLFLGLALRLFFAPSKKIARQLFFYSLWYLALLFAAGVADRLILA